MDGTTTPQNSLESRVGKLEGQLSQLVTTVTDFVDKSENWRGSLSRDISKLSQNISDRTRPNLTLYVSFAALAVSVIIAFISLLGVFFSREQTQVRESVSKVEQRSRDDFKALDDKLQREFQLMVNNAEQKYQDADKNSKERNDNVNRDISTLRSWQNSVDDADRAELRARRLKDVGVMYQPQAANIESGKIITGPTLKSGRP